jgi:hypothetical protein
MEYRFMETEDMKVKGEIMISLPLFIINKFGNDSYNKWLKSISPEARKVYSIPINKSEWFPMIKLMAEPTKIMCDLFFNNSSRGAWNCGRFSADYGLKGIYKILVKLCSPVVLINKSRSIIKSFYDPCELSVTESGKDFVIVKITQFPQMDKYIENRIGGWMERAVEVTGCKHVTVNITKSLADKDECTEYRINWK